MRYGVGQSVRRVEDPKFLTGRGRYIDDIDLPGQAHAAIVYAPVAHAGIKSIDIEAAAAAPGVLGVYTADDIAADGLGGIVPRFMPDDFGGPAGYRTERPLLAARVLHVGERVALVVAESLAQARGAAELIAVDYDERPAVVDAVAAKKPDAPRLYEGAENNVSVALAVGDKQVCENAFAAAAHIVTLSLRHQRVTANSLEPRGAIGVYDAGSGQYTLYASTQLSHIMRTEICRDNLKIPESRLRVIGVDVGGGFGMKTTPHPEDVLVLWAARKVGRPVKWIPSRSEAMLGDDQGRDQSIEASLALDAEGRFLAIRYAGELNVGAYIVGSGIAPLFHTARLASSVYTIGAFDLAMDAVFTNTPPVVPYRGAGRPEAIFAVERLIDKAAREMGIDRAEIRRRNFIAPDRMPYQTHMNFIYDSGEFETVMDKCVAAADWAGFAARRADSEARGRLRGIGLSCYIEDAGNLNDRMDIRFDPSGSATVYSGLVSTGQGHETTFRQLLSDWLGLPFDDIRFVQADTELVAFGRGTYASRSMVVGGSALRAAADDIIAKAKKLAARHFEADAADVEFADGCLSVTGTDKEISLADMARLSFRPGPVDLGIGLEGSGGFFAAQPSFPNGCQICELEVDPTTGDVDVLRWTVVDDVGRVVNPMLVRGQVQGGIAQGIGQVLFEEMAYEAGSGQLLTGSFMDYTMPRADDLPNIHIEFHEVPCKSNPLGVKGCGEGGTVGALPAIVNALVDALAPRGVTELEMPATPARIRAALAAHGSRDAAQ